MIPREVMEVSLLLCLSLLFCTIDFLANHIQNIMSQGDITPLLVIT